MKLIATGKSMWHNYTFTLSKVLFCNGLKIGLGMRLTIILVTTFTMNVAAKGHAQEAITIAETNVPITKVFAEIEKQTSYTFVYHKDLIEPAPIVSVSVKNAGLKEVLDLCLRGLSIGYEIVQKNIVLQRKPSVAISSPGAGYIDVRGKVVNEKGDPVEGVTVTVKGTKIGTATDVNGEFSIKTVDPNAVLIFSSVNMEAFELNVNGQIELLVSLKTKVSSLQDVVINKGYYTTSQKLNTGNVARVAAEEIGKQPVSNPLAALEGRVAGMVISQQTGSPGGGFNVQIRGQKSIRNGNDPLYVIDGVPYISQLLPILGTTILGSGSPLNYINPSDIESIEILKDADATAIYGSRGANGVILISTKKGKPGPAQINASFYYGGGKITRSVDLLNTDEYLEMRHEAFKNDAAVPNSTNYDVNGKWDTTRFTDWQKLLIGKTARITDAQISLSGGSLASQYVIGGGYHKETTVFPGDFGDIKGSAHFSLTSTGFNGKLRITLSSNYIVDNNNILYNDLANNMTSIQPDAPQIYDSGGNLNLENNTFANPFSYLLVAYKQRTTNLVSNAMATYKLLPGLELKLSAGYSQMQAKEVVTFPIAYFKYQLLGSVTTGSSNFSNNSINTWIVEPQLNYNLDLKKAGSINVIFGSSTQNQIYDGQILYATGYTNDALLTSMQAATGITLGNITSSRYKYNALFGRVNYNLSNKYILNLTGRRDGSSRFAPENQFYGFGSIGTAWIFSNEKFVERNLGFLSYGKIRASYGTMGNDQIGDYKYLELYNYTRYTYQGGSGLYPANIFSPDYRWELNRNLEIGLELGLLKDKVLFTASWFKNRSSNQLVGYQLPDITGFRSITANLPATVQNGGWEININTTNIVLKNFRWSSSFNISLPKNKLVDFPNLTNSAYANALILGQPISIKKLFKLSGVNTQTGTYEFINSKGDITSSPSSSTDLIAYINPTPQYFGGFQNSFSFKGFQLDFLIQFVKQLGPNYLFKSSLPPGFDYNNVGVQNLKRWQKPGDIAKIQKFTQSFGSAAYVAYQNARNSDYSYTDASFIRLKNASISYKLPRNLLKRAGIISASVFVQGQNLFTISNYIGQDPENGSFNLPPLRIITAGIHVSL